MYEQLDIFDMTRPIFKINKPVRLIELFAGVGSQAMALRDLGVDFEHYRISEWEVNANRSYKAIHNPNDNTDYSKKFEKFKWLARVLYEYGISVDGKTRLTLKEIRNRGEKWCRQTYNEFRENRNIGSIANAHALDLRIVDTDKFCYIMTYSFPCQDLSVAGKQKGMTKGSDTRSGLLWEVERLMNECSELPQVLLMENVPQVHSKANMPDFQKWIDFLESRGYSNYWQDLNAKDYGVAQNRDRCFMVSLLGEWNYKFPQPIALERKLKDCLEDEVDEKYYINGEKTQKLIRTLIENGTLQNDCDYEMDGNFNQRGKVHTKASICRTILGNGHTENEPKVFVDLSLNNPREKSVSNCITAKEDRGDIGTEVSRKWSNRMVKNHNLMVASGGRVKQLGNTMPTSTRDNPNQGRVYDVYGLSPAITDISKGGGREPMIVAMRGRNPDNLSDRTAGSLTEQRLEPNSQGICNTLTSVQKDNMALENVYDFYNNNMKSDGLCGTITGGCGKGGSGTFGVIESQQYRIRKLTPLECWRLMGFSDEDFYKAEEVNSNTQLYKQAGNSIVKDVLMAILKQMI